MNVEILRYEAFASVPGKGNPAGVVLDGDLPTEVMQHVAQRVGFNETAFVVSVQQPDSVCLRYFTPGHEVDLCGHATIAAFAALEDCGRLRHNGQDPSRYLLHSKAGELGIRLERDLAKPLLIWMQQPGAKFVPFEGDPSAVARAIGLTADDLASEFPIVYGSTGLWTLIVPVKGLDAMRRMQADNPAFPAILGQMPRVSIHPFCTETLEPDCHMHGRHFSSPYSGTVEDPVTGTASGVMGAYYAKYIRPTNGPRYSLLVEQGQEVARDGRVHVEVQKVEGEYHIQIGGTAVFVGAIQVSTEPMPERP